MSPSEYQELAEFIAEAFDRQRRETRELLEAFRKEMLEETRRVVGVSVEELRTEIRIVAEGVPRTVGSSRRTGAGSRRTPVGSR